MKITVPVENPDDFYSSIDIEMEVSEYLETYDDYSLLYDYALMIVPPTYIDKEYIEEHEKEIIRRGLSIPKNARWEYNQYAYMKQKLIWD